MPRESFVSTAPFTISGGGIHAIRCPAKAWIMRMTVVEINGSSFESSLFNRAFSFDSAVNIHGITNDGNGKCLIEAFSPLALSVGDNVLVASTGVGGYNTTHRVTGLL